MPAAGTAGIASKEQLRSLKMRREGRKRKVLEVDHGDGANADAAGEGGGQEDEGEAQKELMGEVGGGGVDGAGLDLSSLEFYMAQDVGEVLVLRRYIQEFRAEVCSRCSLERFLDVCLKCALLAQGAGTCYFTCAKAHYPHYPCYIDYRITLAGRVTEQEGGS